MNAIMTLEQGSRVRHLSLKLHLHDVCLDNNVVCNIYDFTDWLYSISLW